MADFPAFVGIVGGGRWARQHALTLLDILPQSARIHVVSEANPEGWIAFREELSPQQRIRLVTSGGLQEISDRSDLGMVVVARRATDHADTAAQLLRSGKNVLVEKPVALDPADAERLVRVAAPNQCAVSLPFLYASYLDRFLAVAASVGAARRVRIVWHDGSGEIRHGAAKRFDPSVNIVLDVFAHIWSLLVKSGLTSKLELTSVATSEGGAAVVLTLQSGDTTVDVSLKRNAEARRRLIAIQGDSGVAELDFSSEPGSASIDGRAIPVGEGFGSPLARMLTAVSRAFSEGGSLGPQSVDAMLEPTRMAFAGFTQVRAHQLQLLGGASNAPGCDYAMREIVLDQTVNSPARRARLEGAGLADPAQIVESARAWLRGAAIAEPAAQIFSELDQLRGLAASR